MFPQPIIYDEEVCAACGPTLFQGFISCQGFIFVEEGGKGCMGKSCRKTFIVRTMENLWNLMDRGAGDFILMVKTYYAEIFYCKNSTKNYKL
jgi:hypothetical protein